MTNINQQEMDQLIQAQEQLKEKAPKEATQRKNTIMTSIDKLINRDEKIEIEEIIKPITENFNLEHLKAVSINLFKRKLIIDEANKEVYKFFVEYFNLDDLPKKGILLNGAVGSGKSYIFKLINFLCYTFDKPNIYLTVNASEIANSYGAFGDKYMIELYGKTNSENLLIDDLGSEPSEVVHYGNKINIMEKFLLHRYEIFQSTGLLTHFTSNLRFTETNNDILSNYGERVNDRIIEMIVKKKFNSAESRRK